MNTLEHYKTYLGVWQKELKCKIIALSKWLINYKVIHKNSGYSNSKKMNRFINRLAKIITKYSNSNNR